LDAIEAYSCVGRCVDAGPRRPRRGAAAIRAADYPHAAVAGRATAQRAGGGVDVALLHEMERRLHRVHAQIGEIEDDLRADDRLLVRLPTFTQGASEDAALVLIGGLPGGGRDPRRGAFRDLHLSSHYRDHIGWCIYLRCDGGDASNRARDARGQLRLGTRRPHFGHRDRAQPRHTCVRFR
jgi:hypothetical protein